MLLYAACFEINWQTCCALQSHVKRRQCHSSYGSCSIIQGDDRAGVRLR